MVVEQSLERDQPLLDILVAVPVADLLGAGDDPAAKKPFHSVDGLTDFIVRSVDNIIEKKLRYEAKKFGNENGRNSS